MKLDWLEWGRNELPFLHPEEARLECERMLEALTASSRMEIYLDPRPTPPEFFPRYAAWIEARKNRIPLAYLLRKAPFWNFELEVQEGVFIPRPETEILIEAFLESSTCTREAKFSFLDFGTGSGNIAITIATLFTRSRGIALDFSEKALGQARQNADQLGIGARIDSLRADGISVFERGTFDVIFSNPPYVPSRELRSLEPELAWEPRRALDGGEDGLRFYQKILRGLGSLKKGGSLWLEVGYGQREAVQSLFEEEFQEIKIFQDWNQIERVIAGFHYYG